MRNLIASILLWIETLKPYTLVDNCGTKMKFWTGKGAEEWLPYCGKAVVIARKKRVILSRIQY